MKEYDEEIARSLFHYDAIEVFRNMLYKGVYRTSDIVGNEKQIKDALGNRYIKGFEIKDHKTKKLLFLPSKYVSQMPIKVKSGCTTEVVFSGKVYHIIEDVIELQPQPADTMGFARMFDDWFALKHTNEDHKTNMKFIVLTNEWTQSAFRAVTRQAFGKDGIVNTSISITDCGKKVQTVSHAKFAQLMEYPYTCFNEIAGFDGERKEIMENLLIQVCDGNPIYEHTTTGSDKTRSSYDIGGYGATICHNIPSYYTDKMKDCFEQMFGDQLIYRIMPFLLEGAIASGCPIAGLKTNFVKLVKDNLGYYQAWLGQFQYMQQIIKERFLTYNVSKYDLRVDKAETDCRWSSSFNKLALVVQLYMESKYADEGEREVKFYERMDNLYESHKAYIDLLKKEGLM